MRLQPPGIAQYFQYGNTEENRYWNGSSQSHLKLNRRPKPEAYHADKPREFKEETI
jgi:hypothetical protein